MAIVNEYIDLEIVEEEAIDSSYCITNQNENYIFLTFGLFKKDCLFDLEDKNYLTHIRIAKTYFEKYNEVFNVNIEKQHICCNTQSRVLELIHCKLTGINRKLFLESAILYLLFQSQKNNLIFQLGCDTCSVLNNPTDKKKMHLAKSYIINNLANNLTIPIIASAVGTNQCYLKKGFKEIFGQTLFEFIQENRMTKAKYLLENSSNSITEIAYTVGYASLSSFSQAYKNYFGISPLEQAKAIIPFN
ncbi:MAG: AraC family transcriptional regulator [Chitinophagaceae bacterium]